MSVPRTRSSRWPNLLRTPRRRPRHETPLCDRVSGHRRRRGAGVGDCRALGLRADRLQELPLRVESVGDPGLAGRALAGVLGHQGVDRVGDDLQRRGQSVVPSQSQPPGASRHRAWPAGPRRRSDRKSTRLNSSHITISYAVFCLKKKKKKKNNIKMNKKKNKNNKKKEKIEKK